MSSKLAAISPAHCSYSPTFHNPGKGSQTIFDNLFPNGLCVFVVSPVKNPVSSSLSQTNCRKFPFLGFSFDFCSDRNLSWIAFPEISDGSSSILPRNLQLISSKFPSDTSLLLTVARQLFSRTIECSFWHQSFLQWTRPWQNWPPILSFLFLCLWGGQLRLVTWQHRNFQLPVPQKCCFPKCKPCFPPLKYDR